MTTRGPVRGEYSLPCNIHATTVHGMLNITKILMLMHNEELRKLYASPNIIRVIKPMRWAEHVARVGGMRNTYKIWVGKPEGKRPLGRLRLTRENNFRIVVTEIGWKDVDWIL
jgi:hypothetical protein